MDNLKINLNYLKIRLFIIIIIMNNQNKKFKQCGALGGLGRQYIYMITIRKHQVKDFVTVCELASILDNLIINDLGWASCHCDNIVYEVDRTYKQLHLHCILYSDINFRYSKYSKAGKFRIHFRRVYNFDGAVGYLKKQVFNKYEQEQLIDENYFNHNYGFI